MKPDRIVVGTDNPRTAELLRSLYEPFTRNRDRMIVMDVRSAELTKYAANAMLATKISFMNEMANLAERMGADIEKVRLGIGSDPRIGYSFIYPGAGYGGSCFPKDVKALVHSAREHGFDARLLASVEAVNDRQKQVLFDKINAYFGGELRGTTIALWGLAFKPNTDDMREAPSRDLIEALWSAGADVRAYDPVAMPEARRIYGERPDLVLAESAEQALVGADALAILTEWQEFRSPDFDAIRDQLRSPVDFRRPQPVRPGAGAELRPPLLRDRPGRDPGPIGCCMSAMTCVAGTARGWLRHELRHRRHAVRRRGGAAAVHDHAPGHRRRAGRCDGADRVARRADARPGAEGICEPWRAHDRGALRGRRRAAGNRRHGLDLALGARPADVARRGAGEADARDRGA